MPFVQGVTVPQRQPEVAPARFGFVDNAERINSRACMVSSYSPATAMPRLSHGTLGKEV